jgi:hypothetical protein
MKIRNICEDYASQQEGEEIDLEDYDAYLLSCLMELVYTRHSVEPTSVEIKKVGNLAFSWICENMPAYEFPRSDGIDGSVWNYRYANEFKKIPVQLLSKMERTMDFIVYMCSGTKMIMCIQTGLDQIMALNTFITLAKREPPIILKKALAIGISLRNKTDIYNYMYALYSNNLISGRYKDFEETSLVENITKWLVTDPPANTLEYFLSKFAPYYQMLSPQDKRGALNDCIFAPAVKHTQAEGKLELTPGMVDKLTLLKDYFPDNELFIDMFVYEVSNHTDLD